MVSTVTKVGSRYKISDEYAHNPQQLLAKLYRYEREEQKILHNEENAKTRIMVRECSAHTKIPYYILGTYAGVSRTHIAQFVNGMSNFSEANLHKIQNVCNVLTNAVESFRNT